MIAKGALFISRRIVLLIFLSTGVFVSPAMAASSDVLVVIEPDKIIREHVPQTMFGFNIEWMGFDYGYMRGGVVRRDLIAMLKPFQGAIYRYPGGTVSSYFNWIKSIGPHDQRSPQTNQWGQKIVTQFGFDEFRSFLQEVGGVPVVVLNLWGEKAGAWPAERIAKHAESWLRYANRGKRIDPKRLLQPCLPATECRIGIWELGNEMDWGEQSMNADQYGALAIKVASRLKVIDSGLHMLIGGLTASMGQRRMSFPDFEEKIGQLSGRLVDGLSLHSYYDGVNIPGVLGRIGQAINGFAVGRRDTSFDVFITEHARWPAQPKNGKWEDNWHQTTDISGAISSADFWLGVVPNPQISGLAWHALAARGPWPLFSVSDVDDRLIPSVPYWALKVLRAGFLDKVVFSRLTNLSDANAEYSGGYNVRAMSMRSHDGQSLSLLAVNRANRVQNISLVVPTLKSRAMDATFRYITGSDAEERNDESNSSRIEMREKTIHLIFDAAGTAEITLPKLSVSSVLLNNITLL